MAVLEHVDGSSSSPPKGCETHVFATPSISFSPYAFNWFMAAVRTDSSELCGMKWCGIKVVNNAILFVSLTSWCFFASTLVVKSALVGASFMDIRSPKAISAEGVLSLLNSLGSLQH